MSLWKKVCIAAVMGAGNDWAVDTLRAPGFRVGMNPELFALDDLTLEPGDGVELVGASLYQLLIQHEVVILQHWPPASFIERLRADGVQEVMLWCDFEAIPQKGYWSAVEDEMASLARSNLLLSDTPNTFGANWVDVYEDSSPAPPEKPHTFQVNVTKPGYSASYIQTLGNILFSVYGNARPRLFFDNVLDREYFGTASNAPDRDDQTRILAWRKAWHDMLSYLRKIGWVPLWGNSGAVNYEYPELDCKMDELIFTQHLSPEEIGAMADVSMEAGTLAKHGHEQGFCFHVDTWGGADQWAYDPLRWQALKRTVKGKSVYVVTARTSKFLFHPGRDICT